MFLYKQDSQAGVESFRRPIYQHCGGRQKTACSRKGRTPLSGLEQSYLSSFLKGHLLAHGLAAHTRHLTQAPSLSLPMRNASPPGAPHWPTSTLTVGAAVLRGSGTGHEGDLSAPWATVLSFPKHPNPQDGFLRQRAGLHPQFLILKAWG